MRARPSAAALAALRFLGLRRSTREPARLLGAVLLAGLACAGPQPPAPEPDSAETAAFASLARAEDERRPAAAELLELLEQGSPEARQRVALAMGRIQSATYGPALATAALEGPAPVRRAALFALGQLGLAEGVSIPAEATSAARRGLSDGDPSIAAAAVQALGKLAPPQASEELVELLRHPAPEVREQAAFALFRLRFSPVWRKQVGEPPALPATAIEASAAALGDEDVRVRRAAAHTFSRYGQREARQALERALSDSDELVRIFAARGLGKAGDAGAAGGLEARLGDASARVRGEVLRALTALGTVGGIPADLAEDPDLHVRAAAAQAWGRDEGETSGRSLETLLEDPSPTVRAAAVGALARRRGEAFARTLDGLLGTAPWTLRVAAATAARHTGPAAAGLLDRALGDPDTRVQAAAIESLAETSPEDGATERIARALASEDLAVRGTAVTALASRRHPGKIEWLEQTVSSSPGVDWIEIREGVVDAVGEGEGSEALLRRLAMDPAPSVARRARSKLEGLGADLGPLSETAPAPAVPSPFLGRTFPAPPVVVLETEKGTLEIQTLAREAPVHVANFVQLVGEGFYDGLIWHRVVPNFVIQGGDPLGNGWGGPGYALRDEIHPRPFKRGSVGMPKAGKDTGGCQIFITHIPTPHLDGNYTIFGEVVSGLEVIDRIEVGDRILRAYVRD